MPFLNFLCDDGNTHEANEPCQSGQMDVGGGAGLADEPKEGLKMLNEILSLFSQFAIVGGGLWLVWGAIVTGGALRDQNGPQIQTGIWQIVGGGLILAAAILFRSIAVP